MPQDIYEKAKSVPQPKRRGRTRRAFTKLTDMLAVMLYEWWLARLRARHARSRLPNSPRAEWWQGPPHERAARIVAKRLGGRNIGYRTVLNTISKKPLEPRPGPRATG